jgi:eukaryotic-like serine/threonine-protein kinase
MTVDPARVQQIFNEAVHRAEKNLDRSEYLKDACNGDSALRERIEQLLAAHDSAGDFFKLAESDSPAGIYAPMREASGTKIGSYKLLEQIGEGGFGVVFMAEQEQPIHRRVALKIIKLGMDTRQVVARFEAERQALAMMDHENIAKVFDAGTTETGRPYFVMELVKGAPITTYCDEHNLSIPQRLKLFGQVCMAVQHAHQKGIIHRDIKPTNVLVAKYDNDVVPKVIDFGVAKATQVKLTDKTLFTGFRQLIGTPTYMSPEQAQWGGLDVDTRTDIYSLGVLLYELLTGTTPFDAHKLMAAAYEEMQRIVTEVEPPKPSTRISELKETLPSVAERRAIEPRKLDAVIRGDLDWITMKALEKDRARRYESASALAEDIINFLSDEPVSAAAPTKLYRLRKFVGRNKLLVMAGCAVLAALVVGVIGTTIGLVGQARQRVEAEAAREESKAVSDFLTDDLLGGADPSRLPDKTVRDQIVKAMIDPAAATVADRFKEKPLVEAAVQLALANSYAAVGRDDLALPHARRSLEIRRRLLGDDHQDTLISARFLAVLLRSMGKLNEAAPLLRGLLAKHRGAFGNDSEATIYAITGTALQLQSEGKFDEAEQLCREGLKRSRHLFGNNHETTIMCKNNLGYVLVKKGKLAEAEPLLKDTFENASRVLGETHRGTLRVLDNMGVLLAAQGKPAEAEPLYRTNLARCRKVFGNEDQLTLSALNNLVNALVELGKFDEAERLARESMNGHQRLYGDNHPETLITLVNLGLLLRREGKLYEALKFSADGLQRTRRVCGENHPNTLYAITNMGTLYMAQRRFDLAEPFLLDVLERSQQTLPADHFLIADTIYNVANLRRQQGRLSEAKPLYEKALDLRRRLLGDAHPYTNHVLFGLAMVIDSQGDHKQAMPMLRRALIVFQKVFGPDHSDTSLVHLQLARCLTGLGNYIEVEPELAEVDRILKASGETQVEARRRLYESYVNLYESWEKATPGKGHAAQAAQWRDKLAAATARTIQTVTKPSH